MNTLLPIIASMLFFFLPISIGLNVIKIFKLKKKDVADASYAFLFWIPISFIIGMLLIHVLVTAGILHLGAGAIVGLLALSIGLNVVFALHNLHLGYTRISFKQPLLILGYLFLLVLASQIIWKWNSPMTTSLDWDLFFHQTVINSIKQGVPSAQITQLTDSARLDAYSTMFHNLAALAQYPFKMQSTVFWWFAGIFQVFFVALVSFSMGASLRRFSATDRGETNHRHELLTGAVAALLGTLVFESYLAYTPFFLAPQTLTATALAGALSWLFFYGKSDLKTSIVVIVLAAVFGVLGHYAVGVFAVCVIVAVYAYLLMTKYARGQYVKYVLLILACVGSILVPIILKKQNLSLVNPGEAEYYILSVKETASYFAKFYGYFVFPMILISVVYLIWKRTTESFLLAILLIANVSIFVSPIPYVLKFYTFSRFIVNGVFAYVLVSALIFALEGTVSTRKHTFVKGAFLIVMGAFLLINLTGLVEEYKRTPTYKNLHTHISPTEQGAATFIGEKYKGSNTLIVSDPATMFLLEGASGVNSPGGAYASEETRTQISRLFYTRDSKYTAEKVLEIRDGLTGSADKYLLVLSGRYFLWAKSDDDRLYGFQYNIWQPHDLALEDYEFLNFLRDSAKLPIVYKDKGIVIFEVDRWDF